MNVLDLFSGIGGFSLGLERAGMRTVAFCEIDPYCRAVLAKHWPQVPCFQDVRGLGAEQVASLGAIDVICGGFPCQDISTAGNGAGLAGERSGLWSEYRRLIEQTRPQFAVIENVAALRSRGLEVILGQLAELGYDAEWRCIRAADFGAPHLRNRLWIVAYPQCFLIRKQPRWSGGTSRPSPAQLAEHGSQWGVADADCERAQIPTAGLLSTIALPECAGPWAIEPDVGRVVNGVPSRVDRLRCLGNSIVPQIAEAIGRAILRASVG